jgi:outer membrane protein TolC
LIINCFYELINLAEKQNPLLQAQIINKRVSELQLKQVKRSLSYDSCQHRLQLRSNQSSLGFITQSTSRGLNYGFNASLNLFDGLAQNRNEKIATIQIETAAAQIEQQV